MASLNDEAIDALDKVFKAEEAKQVEVTSPIENIEEHQIKWAKRADVIYHFFAYRYFDCSPTCLDLLNFSDADVDSFNLTANKARGLNNWHVYADYLKKLDDKPTLETNTYRRRFIYHVHDYNKTHPAHFRFYLQNLTSDDVEYLEGLFKQESIIGNLGDREVKSKKVLIWASSCVEDEIEDDVLDEGADVLSNADHVAVAVEKCLNVYGKELRTKADEKVKVIRDELTEQFKTMGIESNEDY